MTEPIVTIQLKLTQTQCFNRGISDLMRSTTLMQNGDVVLDYETLGVGMFHGTVVGTWKVDHD